MVKTRRVTAASHTKKVCIDPLPSGAAQLYHNCDGLSVCFQTSRVCCQTRRRHNRPLFICHHITDCNKGGIRIRVHGLRLPQTWTPIPIALYLQCYKKPNDGATLYLSVARTSCCSVALRLSVVTVQSDHEKKEIDISAHIVCDCLRLAMVCCIYIKDTHTHRHIYSVTVVMPRPHVKI